jgi:hypothetical protein
MAVRRTPPVGQAHPPVAPVLWQALTGARDAALAAGASPAAALEAARQLALAAFPALPRTHLREALGALAEMPAAHAGTARLGHGPGQPVTFRLTPRPDRRWHADWLGSRYAGPCLVGAGDEDAARALAARHFRSAEPRLFEPDPWRRRDLVTAEAGGRLPPLPHGMVVPVLGQLGG